MSEPDLAAPSSPLLARKGSAVPAAALARGRAGPPEPQTNGHRSVAASSAETSPAATEQPDKETSADEPAPPGSLLSFSLRRRGESGEIPAADMADAAVVAPMPEHAAEAAAVIGFSGARQSPYRWAAAAAVALIAVAAVGGAWYGYDRDARDIGQESPTPTPAASIIQADDGPTPPAAEPAPTPEEPSFDVVRVSPSGDAVIAGRAAPHTELIVLDNGEPIGTVQADAVGDWLLIPAAPLYPGEHEFSLVVKTPQGTIVLPPPPAPKPEAAGTPATTSAFLVQLASVKSATGATEEWSRLQRDFPDLLADKKLRVDRANLGKRGAFFRIRTGPFDDREQAHGLCRELTAREQSCLVIER